MAKKKKKPKSTTWSEPSYQGMNHEELVRALGLHELTYEACVEGLFGDLLDPPAEQEPTPSSWRVTQMGPGHRHQPKKED